MVTYENKCNRHKILANITSKVTNEDFTLVMSILFGYISNCSVMFLFFKYRPLSCTYQFQNKRLSKRSKFVWYVNWRRSFRANTLYSLANVKFFPSHNVTPAIHWNKSGHVHEHWPLSTMLSLRIWYSLPKLLASVFVSNWMDPNWLKFIWIKINKPPLNTR